METQDLVFAPALEIVDFGGVDIVRTSFTYTPGENETPTVPPLT